MSFEYPHFLYALFATAIPVIIHLFNFRKYKKIYFTNVKFLREVQHQTQSRNKLKQLLVLLARILAISALALAFAQPFIPVADQVAVSGVKSICIYIDNSFSMDAAGNYGRLLDEAKQKAYDISDAYGQSDRFQLLTNDFEGKHQRFVNREQLTEYIEEVDVSPSVRNISEVISRQKDLLDNNTGGLKRAYIISDFQKSTSDLELLKAGNFRLDTSVLITMIPLAVHQQSNLMIDSCWFESPARQINQPQKLFAKIKNLSETSFENIPVKLIINNEQKALASVSINADETIEQVLSFTLTESGFKQALVEITDYPVTFDDKFYLSFEIADNIAVASINSNNEGNPVDSVGNTYINSLWGNDSYIKLTNVYEKNMNYLLLSDNRIIILNELHEIASGLGLELARFVNNGGGLIVFPAAGMDMESFSRFLSQNLGVAFYTGVDTGASKIEKINLEHPFFSDIFEETPENMDLPTVHRHFIISRSAKSKGETLLSLINGNIFFARYPSGKGSVYLSAVPLNDTFSNFARHSLFVPLIYKTALYSQSGSKMYYSIGRDNSLETTRLSASGDAALHIKKKNSDNDFDIIPEQRISEGRINIILHNQISDAGNYSVTINDSVVKAISFNYNRKESDLQCYGQDKIKEILNTYGLNSYSLIDYDVKNLASVITEINEGKKLWKVCIILALVFIAVEILLLRKT